MSSSAATPARARADTVCSAAKQGVLGDVLCKRSSGFERKMRAVHGSCRAVSFFGAIMTPAFRGAFCARGCCRGKRAWAAAHSDRPSLNCVSRGEHAGDVDSAASEAFQEACCASECDRETCPGSEQRSFPSSVATPAGKCADMVRRMKFVFCFIICVLLQNSFARRHCRA